MAPHLRDIDSQEIWAMAAMKPLEALLYSVNESKQCLTAINPDSDIPIMMFGLGNPANLLDRRRSIWLLGTDQTKLIKRRFVLEAGQYLETLAAGETVYNYVLEGNQASLRWLRMLGFSIMEPKPFGWLQKPFHYVERKFSKCALSPYLQSQH